MSGLPQREPLADQIADLIRGSAALREDIADELADHLASHAEESGIRDPQAALGEAVKAFGDPRTIARELRTVHLGAQIMFQKVMIVVLLLVVGVMGMVTYLSWSTTRDITAQMASVSKQTGMQLEELGRRMSEMGTGRVDQQLPRLKIRCVSGPQQGPQQQAVADYTVTVKSIEEVPAKEKEDNRTTTVFGRAFTKDYTSGSNGQIDSGPLQQGMYQLSGEWEPTLDGKAAGSASWRRTVRLQQMGQVEEVVVEIPTTVKYEVRLQGDILKYWDPKRMPNVALSVGRNIRMPNDCDFSWNAEIPIHTAGTSVVTGLISGKERYPRVLLPARDPKDRYERSMLSLDPLDPPRDGGAMNIALSWPAEHVSGIVRMDEQGTPARGMQVEVSWQNHVESLVTDDRGRFESQWGWADQFGPGSTPYVLRIPWHSPDGQSAAFEYPILGSSSCPIEVNLSKLASLRVQFVNSEKVESRFGMLLLRLSWLKLSENESPGMRMGNRMDRLDRWMDLRPSTSVDLLALPGSYEVDVGELRSHGNSISQTPDSIKVDLAPNEVRVLNVDVERLVPAPLPRQPMPPRPRNQSDKAISLVGPAASGPGEQATTRNTP